MSPEVSADYRDCTPLRKRIGEVEDIANVSVVPAVGRASYVTGQIINVDGGMQVRRGPDYSAMFEPRFRGRRYAGSSDRGSSPARPGWPRPPQCGQRAGVIPGDPPSPSISSAGIAGSRGPCCCADRRRHAGGRPVTVPSSIVTGPTRAPQRCRMSGMPRSGLDFRRRARGGDLRVRQVHDTAVVRQRRTAAVGATGDPVRPNRTPARARRTSTPLRSRSTRRGQSAPPPSAGSKMFTRSPASTLS